MERARNAAVGERQAARRACVQWRRSYRDGMVVPTEGAAATVGLLLERHRLRSLRDIQVHHAKLFGHDAIGRKEEVP